MLSTAPSHPNTPSSFGNRILFTCDAATVFILSLSMATPRLLQVWLLFSSRLRFEATAFSKLFLITAIQLAIEWIPGDPHVPRLCTIYPSLNRCSKWCFTERLIHIFSWRQGLRIHFPIFWKQGKASLRGNYLHTQRYIVSIIGHKMNALDSIWTLKWNTAFSSKRKRAASHGGSAVRVRPFWWVCNPRGQERHLTYRYPPRLRHYVARGVVAQKTELN